MATCYNVQSIYKFSGKRYFSSNFSPFNTAKTYQLTDSTHIKIIPQGAQNPLLYFFKLDSINNALLLSPANPMCIEGCGQKFLR